MGFFDFAFSSLRETNKKPLDFFNETASELSPDETNTIMSNSKSGISVKSINDTFKVSYNGLLAKSGAHEITLVLGYGDENHWEDIDYFPMKKIDHEIFETYFPVLRDDDIHMAFKDNCDNWDNNYGKNFTISGG